MSQNGDMARLGVYTLRDESHLLRGVPKERRIMTYGSLIKEFDSDGDPNRDDSLGDMFLGWTMFKKGTRKLPGWSGCWASIYLGYGKAMPVKGAGWATDDEFYPKSVSLPYGLSDLPYGTAGIVVAGTRSDGPTEDLFLPGGSAPLQLIAVTRLYKENKEKDIMPRFSKGTDVYDLDKDNKPDPIFNAKIQTAWRVMKPCTEAVHNRLSNDAVTFGAGVTKGGE